MKRYLVIDWGLQSIWITNDLSYVNCGESCRYGDTDDMIAAVVGILEERKNDNWGKYIRYLKEWVKQHEGIENTGMAPSCYDEFLENEAALEEK